MIPYSRQQLLTGDLLVHMLPAGLTCRPSPYLELFPSYIIAAELLGTLSVCPMPGGIELAIFGDVFLQVCAVTHIFAKEFLWLTREAVSVGGADGTFAKRAA